MTQEILYTYLGDNGVLTTAIYLEGVHCVKHIRLKADKGKLLTKDDKRYASSTVVPEKEVSLWYEVEEELVKGQK